MEDVPRPGTAEQENELAKRGLRAAWVGTLVGVGSLLIAVLAFWSDWGGKAQPVIVDTAASEEVAEAHYKLVTDSAGIIRMSVPEEWGAADHGEREDQGVLLGVGLTSGPDPHTTGWTLPRSFVGVSTREASELGLPDLSLDEAVATTAQELEKVDWTIDGCSLQDETEIQTGVLRGVQRIWKACQDLDITFWDSVLIPADRQYVVYIQVSLPASSDSGIASHILDTLQIDAAKLVSIMTPDNEGSNPGSDILP